MVVRLEGREMKCRRVFCIGRNYAAHVAELKNDMPRAPVIFSKPATSLVPSGVDIPFPSHGSTLHHEAEVVVLIGDEGRPEDRGEAARLVAGVSVGVDLTLRDLQDDLRAQGLPWEVSKAFDFSAPVGEFVPVDERLDPANITFALQVNGTPRQQGNTGMMIFDIPTLLVAIGRVWTLRRGDVVFTGTPEGVGPLVRGDRMKVESEGIGTFEWRIV